MFQVPASYVNSLARSRPVTSTALPVTFPHTHTHTHTHSTPCLVLNRPPAPLYPMESRSYNLTTMCVCESICILEPVFAFNLGFEQAHTRPPKAPFLGVLSHDSTQIDRGCAPRSLSSKAAPSLAAAWAVKVPLPVYSQAEVVGGPAGAARERQFTDPAPSPPATTSSTPPHDHHYHYYWYQVLSP